MTNPRDTHRMLLHACCGPCSMEPSRILGEEGESFDIFYANSNIAPEEEYEKRLATLHEWAAGEGISVIEGEYDPNAWAEVSGKPWAAGEISREERCRACYRLRFEEAAAYAAENGYSSLCTTLSVSPYQYTGVIREELERACSLHGIEPRFEDFRPFYDEATRRSRDAGMYRQNYCGCPISEKEAEDERAERKAVRARERELYLTEHADEIAAEQEALEARRRERKAYDGKRARQRAVLKELRQKSKSDPADASNQESRSDSASTSGREGRSKREDV